MESQEVLEETIIVGASGHAGNGDVGTCGGHEDTENPGGELLDQLESYWDDIEEKLTISRMVSDSVIKGMVCAVEQEAAEKIAQKELELARLKETVHLYHVGADNTDGARHVGMLHEPKHGKYGPYLGSSDVLVEHDMLQKSLVNLTIAATEQFKKVKKEIDKIKGYSSISRKTSRSELVGLSGILQEKVPDKWFDVDSTLDVLRKTLDSVHKQVEEMGVWSKLSLLEWQQERDFQAEIEGIVIKGSIQGLQEEFEWRMWDESALSYGNASAKWHERMKEISSICQELIAISNTLSVPESGQLNSHVSLEHQKASGNHVSPTTPLWEGNGKHDASIITVPENFDGSQLEHMSKDELVNHFESQMKKMNSHFKSEMNKMKRQHESQVQEMTEEIFAIKRRGSSLPVRKDKEFDMLRKRIPEVIKKLDDILMENEKLPALSNCAENLGNFNKRLESLRLENHQLRDLLIDKKKELKFLSTQFSDAAEKMSEHSLAEANLLRKIASLKCALEDAHIEAFISEDLYTFLLKQEMGQIKCSNQELSLEHDILQGICETMFRKAAQNVDCASNLEVEDTDIESIITQAVCEIVFREALKEAEEELSSLNMKYVNESEARLSLEVEALQKEQQLRLNIAEKEKLEEDILSLTEIIDRKDMLVQEGADKLAKEKEKFELASQELDDLRVQINQQQELISKSSEESQFIKGNYVEAMEKIELYNGEISCLKRRLELLTENLRETTEEKIRLFSFSQEMQKTLSFVEEREGEDRKQMGSLTTVVRELSKAVADFEGRAEENIKRNNLRLENLSSELSSLIPKARTLRRTGLLYKQRLERRCSDLQKAESEVDLLGDEVDTLLSLLEKIYIALDHYSPILQHYPGIIEILKLVRRELSGESIKPV